MGFWSWLLDDEPKIREETQPEVTPPVSDVLLEALLNNQTITRKEALALPAVSGAVDFITNSIASMPVNLYRHKDGKVTALDDDPRVKMLNGDTGDTLDAFQMKKAMVEDYLLGKGGYCYIERYRNNVLSLRYVEDIYITVLKNFKPIYKDYVICIEGEQYAPYNFIKLLRNTKDGASGRGLTKEISKALETAYQTLLYQLSTVQAGGNKKGFLKSQRKLGQEEINALKRAWKRMYANSSENVVVLNNGIDFQEASNSSVDMQLNQNKNTLRDEINTVFHIHDNDFDLTFKEAIYPIVKAFEIALNRDLLLEKEKQDHYFEFDVKEIVKASLQERYQAYKLAKETSFMTPNEIRRAENMEYIEGLDVINVGLGSVLYDINTHKYYTPNTDTVSDPHDDPNPDGKKGINKMLEDHELAEEFDESGNSAERELRFNSNHDGKTGRFTSKGGSGGGLTGDALKQAQLELIQKYNPKDSSLNAQATWVESVKDIQTWQEAMHDDMYGDGDVTPDFKWADALNAEKTGKITIYSSKPIKEGSFVTPSKMIAQSYGNDTPYSMEVGIDDVAWIDMSEGQFANVNRRSENQRFNPNHDGKTGRFTSKGGGSGAVANSQTQALHKEAIDKLSDSSYNDGSYDIETLKPISYENGYQVTFSQIGDNYSDAEYAEKCNEFLKASSDGKTVAGKFEGTPEISFNVKDRATAEKLGRKYNQISIWDWENCEEIKTGGTGRKK